MENEVTINRWIQSSNSLNYRTKTPFNEKGASLEDGGFHDYLESFSQDYAPEIVCRSVHIPFNLQCIVIILLVLGSSMILMIFVSIY